MVIGVVEQEDKTLYHITLRPCPASDRCESVSLGLPWPVPWRTFAARP
jgi:hypothetical protein